MADLVGMSRLQHAYVSLTNGCGVCMMTPLIAEIPSRLLLRGFGRPFPGGFVSRGKVYSLGGFFTGQLALAFFRHLLLHHRTSGVGDRERRHSGHRSNTYFISGRFDPKAANGW